MQLDLDDIADVIALTVKASQEPLVQRLAAVEQRAPERGEKGDPGQDGRNGKDVDPALVESLKADIDALRGVETRVKAIEDRPAPQDGKDGAPGENGRDGKDVDPVVVDALNAEIATLREVLPRVKALEDRPLPKDGRDGERGADGPPGRDAFEVVLPVVATVMREHVDAKLLPFVTRLEALEKAASVVPAPSPEPVTSDEDVDELVKTAASLLRSELALTAPTPMRVQKRVVRDPQGRIEGIIEESVA